MHLLNTLHLVRRGDREHKAQKVIPIIIGFSTGLSTGISPLVATL